MTLQEALEAAETWKAGYDPEKEKDASAVPVNGNAPVSASAPTPRGRREEPRQKTEEEMVAQNEVAMRHLQARLSTMSGGQLFRN